MAVGSFARTVGKRETLFVKAKIKRKLKIKHNVKRCVSKKEKTKIAGVGTRFGAYFLDGIVIMLITVLPIVYLQMNSIITEEWQWKVIFSLSFLLYLWVTTALYQKTLGKKICGIKVITKNGKRVDWGKAFIREVFGKFLSSSIYGIGYLIGVFTKNNQMLHDIIAGTYVVKEERIKKPHK